MTEKEVIKEPHFRSLLKGLTWRILATTTTIIIAYFITGDIKDGITTGGIAFWGRICL